MGKPNYCGYISILPLLNEVVNSSNSSSVDKIREMISSRESTYKKMREKHDISYKEQEELVKAKSKFSKY